MMERGGGYGGTRLCCLVVVGDKNQDPPAVGVIASHDEYFCCNLMGVVVLKVEL